MKSMRSLLVILMLLSTLWVFSSPVSAHEAHGKQLTPIILFPGCVLNTARGQRE